MGGYLEALDPHEALQILAGLKDKASEIRDPTAWIKKAAMKKAPEPDAKVKKTIVWYNKNGGLQQQIHYESVKTPLASIGVGPALDILKGLETRASEIRDPTWWIIKAVEKAVDRADSWASGATDTDPAAGSSWQTDPSELEEIADQRVVKTFCWFNRHGGLRAPLDAATLGPILAELPAKDALAILKGLEGKGAQIKNPTGWVAGAIEKTMASS